MDYEDNKEQRRRPPKLPPKSWFNDQESTAVLRLLVRQKKLLKNKDENPALMPTPDKSVRNLPPVTSEIRENKLGETGRQKENLVTTNLQDELSHYGHLPACISGEDGRPASAGGIYQSPKLARAKERPKGSYGRRQQQQQQQQHQQRQQQQQQQQQTENNYLRPQSRAQERERKHSHQETITKLKEETLRLGAKSPVSRTRSCPSNYETRIPPINKQSTNWMDSTPPLTNSLSKINLKNS